MYTAYVYVLETMADWELGYITAELNSGRFFKKDAPGVSLKTVGCTTEPIHTMGGLTVTPDCLVSDVRVSGDSVLLLPGANTWSQPEHTAVLKKAGELLAAGATVCAICGATTALAAAGLLDSRPHTSNGPGFLEMFAPGYKGGDFYVDEPSVSSGNLITAGPTACLLWARQIIQRLGVFEQSTLEAWYKYFTSGRAEDFYALMQTLPSGS